MYGLSNLIGVAILIFLLVALARIVTSPFRLALKLLINAASGLVALWLVNLLAPVTGVSLGVNLPNALIVGILGLPGLALLILLKWIL